MVKVLKHGNKIKTDCKNCGCEFTHQAEDVQTVKAGMNEYKYYVICPDCGAEVTTVYMRK